jgi:hypothetical protein
VSHCAGCLILDCCIPLYVYSLVHLTHLLLIVCRLCLCLGCNKEHWNTRSFLFCFVCLSWGLLMLPKLGLELVGSRDSPHISLLSNWDYRCAVPHLA